MSESKKVEKLIILGAGGRDFHNFLTIWKHREDVEVVAFTHAEGQIPISGRTFPASLSGPRYPNGIPILPEDDLEQLIREHKVDRVELAYSDLSYKEVGNLSARCLASGAQFSLTPPQWAELKSSKPVVAVCGVRTGVGKSAVSRYVLQTLANQGLRVAAIRHPMPYDENLESQVVQRFATVEDLEKCSFEEIEEYMGYVEEGQVIWAGIDYQQILAAAEKECDVILFDGGNNDSSFITPDLKIVVADALRPGHVDTYYPGEVNARTADVFLVTKVDVAAWEWLVELEEKLRELNPEAPIVRADFELGIHSASSDSSSAEDLDLRGRNVVCVEDGPSLTHGNLKSGAAVTFCQENGAVVVNPIPFAVGEVAELFKKFPELRVIPNIGYRPEQVESLRRTLLAAVENGKVDLVLTSSPVDLKNFLRLPEDFPIFRISYDLQMKKHQQERLDAMISQLIMAVEKKEE